MSDSQVVLEKADLESAFQKHTDKMDEAIAKANEEAENAKSLSAESKSALDKLSEQGSEVIDRLTALEQRGIDVEEGDSNDSLGDILCKSDMLAHAQQGRGGKLELKTAIVNATGQNQPLVPSDRQAGIHATPNRRLTLRDLVPTGMTTSNLVEYTRETAFTNNAAVQGTGSSPEVFENTTKAESAITFNLQSEPVVTVAHFIPLSKQVVADAPQLRSYVDGRLMYGLKLVEETQMLTGTGSSHQLNGIQTQATAYVPESPNLANEIDIIRDAITQAQVAEYRPNFIVLNPSDWDDIQRRKVGTADDRYVFGDPSRSHDATPLWGLTPLVTNTQTAGTFLLGDTSAAMLFDREQAAIEISFENQANFEQNMCTVRCEERLALVVFRTEAFITGSL